VHTIGPCDTWRWRLTTTRRSRRTGTSATTPGRARRARETGARELTDRPTIGRTPAYSGYPPELAEQFSGLLWGELLVSLLLRVADPPDAREMNRRARRATSAILRLHSTRPGSTGA